MPAMLKTFKHTQFNFFDEPINENYNFYYLFIIDVNCVALRIADTIQPSKHVDIITT